MRWSSLTLHEYLLYTYQSYHLCLSLQAPMQSPSRCCAIQHPATIEALQQQPRLQTAPLQTIRLKVDLGRERLPNTLCEQKLLCLHPLVYIVLDCMEDTSCRTRFCVQKNNSRLVGNAAFAVCFAHNVFYLAFKLRFARPRFVNL